MNKRTGQNRIRLYPGDWLTAAVLLLLSFSVWLFFFRAGERGNEVSVTEGADREIACYGLDEAGAYTIRSGNGYTLVLLIRDGTVSVTEADCPNHVCRDSAPISRVGQVIVCAPAHIRIKITAGGGVADENDFVAG